MVIRLLQAMDGGEYYIFNDNKHYIEESSSNFNQHRREIIKYSIESNLSTAISNYNNYTGSTNNFQMPKLKETEWDKLTEHISIISFLQGLNIGGKVYNGYTVITNTKNKEVVSEDSIYILDTNNEYHRPSEIDLKDKSLYRGVFNIDLERKALSINNQRVYYYPISALGSYSSVISQNNVIDAQNIYDLFSKIGTDNEVARLYFTALGRERYTLYKNNKNVDELKSEQFK